MKRLGNQTRDPEGFAVLAPKLLAEFEDQISRGASDLHRWLALGVPLLLRLAR
jgi:hypothetical protein